MPQRLKVLVVSRPRDVHGDVVLRSLARQNVPAERLSFNTLRERQFAYSSEGLLSIEVGNCRWSVNDDTTVWWRRPGWVESSDLQQGERELVEGEVQATLVGALRGLGVRWIDEPNVIDRAEDKLLQLQAASSLGAAVPEYVVTNSISCAAEFVSNGPTVAKAISSGAGWAPLAATVTEDLVPLVAGCPVLLQRLVASDADLRVVTIGDSLFVWRRNAEQSDPVDWRAVDPAGVGFKPEDPDVVGFLPIKIASTLGLSMSVQDWTVAGNGVLFLEVNPQGQWLFLQDSRQIVVPALTQLLSRGKGKKSEHGY